MEENDWAWSLWPKPKLNRTPTKIRGHSQPAIMCWAQAQAHNANFHSYLGLSVYPKQADTTTWLIFIDYHQTLFYFYFIIWILSFRHQQHIEHISLHSVDVADGFHSIP